MSNHTTSNGSPSSGGDPASKHSFEQLLQAAESGDVGAMEHVSECYARGEGVAQDSAKAAQWLEKVAERGNAKAMVKLAHCYEIGDGVVQSQAAAVPWHLKAAEAGDADGMYWYAWCCAMGAPALGMNALRPLAPLAQSPNLRTCTACWRKSPAIPTTHHEPKATTATRRPLEMEVQ